MAESRNRRDRRDPLRLPGKTSFTEEIVRSEHCNDGFLALLQTTVIFTLPLHGTPPVPGVSQRANNDYYHLLS